MKADTPIFEARHVSLRFGGVRALTDVSFSIDKGELFSIIGPNGAGKTSMVNCISGRYTPTEGQIFFKGQDVTGMTPNNRAEIGIGRTFQNLALFGHMTVLDNIMVGRHHLLKNNFLTGALYWFTGARDRGAGAPPRDRGDHRLPRHPACPQIDRRNAVLRPAQAGRTGARHGAEAGPDPAGRADGRHEPRREGGHGPLHRGPERGMGHDRRDDRARHGRGHGHLPPGHGAGFRQEDRRGLSRGSAGERPCQAAPIWARPTTC